MIEVERAIECVRSNHEPALLDTSHLGLLREFLRLELLWADRLGIRQSQRAASDFYRLAEAIAPATEFPRELFHSIEGVSLAEPMRRVLREAIKWYSAKNAPQALFDSYSLADPYEPLLCFFERGGRFYVEHGTWLGVKRVGAINYASLVEDFDGGRLAAPFGDTDPASLRGKVPRTK